MYFFLKTFIANTTQSNENVLLFHVPIPILITQSNNKGKYRPNSILRTIYALLDTKSNFLYGDRFWYLTDAEAELSDNRYDETVIVVKLDSSNNIVHMFMPQKESSLEEDENLLFRAIESLRNKGYEVSVTISSGPKMKTL